MAQRVVPVHGRVVVVGHRQGIRGDEIAVPVVLFLADNLALLGIVAQRAVEVRLVKAPVVFLVLRHLVRFKRQLGGVGPRQHASVLGDIALGVYHTGVEGALRRQRRQRSTAGEVLGVSDANVLMVDDKFTVHGNLVRDAHLVLGEQNVHHEVVVFGALEHGYGGILGTEFRKFRLADVEPGLVAHPVIYLTGVSACQLSPMSLGRLVVAVQVLQHDRVAVDGQFRVTLPVTVLAIVVQEPDEEGEIRLSGCNHRESAGTATFPGGDSHVDGGDVYSCNILVSPYVLGMNCQQQDK